jgi:hypothetical protein
MARLNPTQRRLVREINNLLDSFNLNPLKITQDSDQESWTPRLQLARNQLIRSQIIMDYTLIDEFLNTRIAHFFFGKRRPFWNLWRTKSFKLFNYHVLEELSLLKKLQLVRAISPLPNKIREDIERLNALRNGIAHAFFPENLKKSKPAWKGKSIFAEVGVHQYQQDMRVVIDYFVPGTPHAFAIKSDDNSPQASRVVGAEPHR